MWECGFSESLTITKCRVVCLGAAWKQERLPADVRTQRAMVAERISWSLARSLRRLARSLERDVKRVYEDVAALIEVGLIEKTERAQIYVPFTVIEADFQLRAA
jgi:predicted transcriptional regulator